MWFKIVILLTFVSVFQCNDYCSDKRTLSFLRRATYKFSVRLLDSVSQDTKSDFVFSPLATWLQLTSLAEGARNKTLREIRRVTSQPRLQCLKKKWKKMINDMNDDLKVDLELRNVIIIDKLLSVKKKFMKNVEKLQDIDVLLFNFNNINKVADATNNFISKKTGGKISNIVYPEIFESAYLVAVGAIYFTSNWKTGFEKQNTGVKDFYSFSGVKLGEVNMMKQTAYFNVTFINVIKSKVLELPCSNERISMLIFIPDQQKNLLNFFYALRRIQIRSIFTMFKRTGPQYLNVELPRFKMDFDYDNIPELVFDMGAKRIFNPLTAEFKDISDYSVYTTVMTQVANLEVTEEGVTARSMSPANLYKINDSYSDFIANKPFVYMLVDKELQVILFAGVYSEPTVY